MGVLIEGAVSVADVAAVTGATVDQVEAEARSLNVFIGVDWAGRPAVTELEASGLVTGRLRLDTDHQAGWAAYQAELEQWSKEREQARSDAFAQAWRVARGRGQGDSMSTDAGHAAGRAAVVQFEREHPEPAYQDGAPAKSWLQKLGVSR
jgi:hypothetical protein